MTSTNKRTVTLGIDLGTTMCCMAGQVHGELQIIDNVDGERITPSVVLYPKDTKISNIIVGSNAIVAAQQNPENFVYEAKRMIGKGFYHPDIQKSIKYWPFKLREIKENKTGMEKEKVEDNIGIVVNVDGKEKIYEPIEISASVLSYLAESAKRRLNEFPTFIVITVPAYFHDGAKQRTLAASTIAFGHKKDENNNNLNVKTVLLAEPTAAAMAYGSMMMKNNQNKGKDERILVFDLGGGTYDVSIVEFFYEEGNPVGEVKATDGDNYLGGGDFDNIIVQMAREDYAAKFSNSESTDALEDKKNDIRLRQEAIKVKTQLSSNTNAAFNLPCYRGSNGIHFDISRNRFERAGRSLFERLEEKVKGVLLSYAGVNPVYKDNGSLDINATISANPKANRDLTSLIESSKKQINRVIMVGGSSRIPKVKQVLERIFGENENTPSSQKKVVSVLNPDESIAYGAGYYANACCPAEGDKGGHILLIDKVPLHLSIETLGGLATPIIEARTPIPAKAKQVFSTAANNQPAVTIRITQGNRVKSEENHLVGQFNLEGIAPAPKGVPQIEVQFEVDENNTLKVTAIDKSSGNQQMFVQDLTNNLTDADIEKMVKTAEENDSADKIYKERVELKNQHENLLYTIEDQVEKVPLTPENKEAMMKILEEERTFLSSPDFMTKDLEETKQHVKDASAKMTEILSTVQQQGNPTANATGNPSDTGNDDVEEVQ